MSKKQMQALNELPMMTDTVTAIPQEATAEPSDRWTRQTSVELALQHHKINGGMLTVAQLIDNANHFHAYITGESK